MISGGDCPEDEAGSAADADSSADEIGAQGATGVLLFAVPVPQAVPLEGTIPVHIGEAFIRSKGYELSQVDQSIIPLPSAVLVMWVRVRRELPKLVETIDRAFDALRLVIPDMELPEPRSYSHHKGSDETSSSDANSSEWESVAVCMLPVLDIAVAKQSGEGTIDAFTIVHWVLQDSIRAIRTSEVLELRDLTYASLPDAVVRASARFENETLTWSQPEMYFLENMMRNFPDRSFHVLDREQIQAAGDALSSLSSRRPGAIVRDLLANAKASRRDGDLRSATMNFAVTCEVFLDQLLFSLLWEEGVAPEVAKNLFDGPTAIMRRARTHYSGRIGGLWDTERKGPVRDWAKLVAHSRNRVVHRGVVPSSQEVDAAEGATHALTAFLAKRLVLSFDKYPRTMSIVTGDRSIESYAPKRKKRSMLDFLNNERFQAESEFVTWLDQWWQ